MKATESFRKKLFGTKFNALDRSSWELYKELEDNNVKELLGNDTKIEYGEQQNNTYTNDCKIHKNVWTVNDDLKIKGVTSAKQSALFLKSMKVIIILGQCLGLYPVMGILQSDASKIRFKFVSWKFLYSVFICAFQMICSMLCLYSMCNSITILIMAFLSFYATASITTILFIKISKRWPRVIHEIAHCQLDEYIDQKVVIRCSLATIMLLILASFEHILSQINTYARILDCTPKAMLKHADHFKSLSHLKLYWLYDVGVPYSLPLAIFITILNTITMINWNYSDMFIICVSLYLISIFDKINEKIEAACNRPCQPWVWRSIREDYTRATRLVRLFDDVISGVIFVSFANNLFFICLQLFNVLQNIVSTKQPDPVEECLNFPSGPLNGYENAAYYTFSLSLIISRFLAVSLLAARVHSSAVKPTAVLYGIPTKYYCTEIQRFIEQIHSDEVALSGLQFFHITKSLVLSVAATIVTYELVLLQFED